MFKKKIKGKIIFLIGLPGSGKTAIGKKLKNFLNKNKITSIHLDGDSLRKILKNYKYSTKERIKLSKIYLELSLHLIRQTDVVILSSVSLNKEVENFYIKHKKIKVFLIKKNFHNLPKSKRKIRKVYKKFFKHDFPNKISKIIINSNLKQSCDKIIKFFSK